MIPSRPLDLGGIIRESIRIVKLTWWRSAILVFIFWLPGAVLTQFGINKLIDSCEDLIQRYNAVSPEAPILMRDYLLTDSSINIKTSLYLRLQYPDLFNAIDSLKYSAKARYSDSCSREDLNARIDSIGSIVHRTNPIQSNDFESGTLLFLFGVGIFILSLAGNIAAQYDLSARAFEERSLALSRILPFVFKRSMWFILVQYCIIGIVMLFGLGIIVGITFAISDILGAFGFIASVVIIIYSFYRLLFSRVAGVSEELTPLNAIKRSLALTKDIFWRIFGITLLCGILITVINTFIRLPFSFIFTSDTQWLVQFIRADSINIPKLFANIRTMIYNWEYLFYVSALLSASFFPAFITTFYYDLRTRHDGVLDYEASTSEISDSDSE